MNGNYLTLCQNFYRREMKIKTIHMDLAKWVWALIAVILVFTGKVDWWIILLFVLWSIEYKVNWEV